MPSAARTVLRVPSAPTTNRACTVPGCRVVPGVVGARRRRAGRAGSTSGVANRISPPGRAHGVDEDRFEQVLRAGQRQHGADVEDLAQRRVAADPAARARRRGEAWSPRRLSGTTGMRCARTARATPQVRRISIGAHVDPGGAGAGRRCRGGGRRRARARRGGPRTGRWRGRRGRRRRPGRRRSRTAVRASPMTPRVMGMAERIAMPGARRRSVSPTEVRPPRHAARIRDGTPVLASRLATWVSTVRGDRNSRSATCALVRPSATSPSTSASRAVIPRARSRGGTDRRRTAARGRRPGPAEQVAAGAGERDVARLLVDGEVGAQDRHRIAPAVGDGAVAARRCAAAAATRAGPRAPPRRRRAARRPRHGRPARPCATASAQAKAPRLARHLVDGVRARAPSRSASPSAARTRAAAPK